MSEAIELGVSRYTLYSLRDEGIIEQVTRGVYRLADLPFVSEPDLFAVGSRYPRAVICLVSALAYHELTSQIPHGIWVAIPRASRVPVSGYPPLVVHRFSGPAYSVGVEEHDIDGVLLRVYNPEKTIADCFKFRHKIGMDIVLEALRLYRARGRFDVSRLLEYARACRVERVMRPYLEASI